MRRLVVLGGGTAGTMAVNRLRKRLGEDEWSITVVDRDGVHLYPPGLQLPFGVYTHEEIVKPRQRFPRRPGWLTASGAPASSTSTPGRRHRAARQARGLRALP